LARGTTYTAPVFVVDVALFECALNLGLPFFRNFIKTVDKVEVSVNGFLPVLDLCRSDASPAVCSASYQKKAGIYNLTNASRSNWYAPEW
jgi:hypothetical protein